MRRGRNGTGDQWDRGMTGRENSGTGAPWDGGTMGQGRDGTVGQWVQWDGGITGQGTMGQGLDGTGAQWGRGMMGQGNSGTGGNGSGQYRDGPFTSQWRQEGVVSMTCQSHTMYLRHHMECVCLHDVVPGRRCY